MSQSVIEYYITGKANLTAIRAAQAQFANLRVGIMRITDKLTSLAGMAGVGGAGFGLFSLVKTGIEFNKTLQVAQRTLAGVFMDNVPGVKTYTKAVKIADEAIAALQKRALTSSADFSDLLDSYTMNASLLFNAGVKDLQKQVDLLALIGEAVKSRGLGGYQFVQEVRALLSGTINHTAAVASSLFPDERSRTSYRKALSEGKAYEVLMEKLKSYAAIQAVAAGHMDVVVSNLGETIKDIAAGETKNLFVILAQELKRLTDWLMKSDTRAKISATVQTGTDVGTAAALGGAGLWGIAKLAPKIGKLIEWDIVRTMAKETGWGRAVAAGLINAAKTVLPRIALGAVSGIALAAGAVATWYINYRTKRMMSNAGVTEDAEGNLIGQPVPEIAAYHEQREKARLKDAADRKAEVDASGRILELSEGMLTKQQKITRLKERQASIQREFDSAKDRSRRAKLAEEFAGVGAELYGLREKRQIKLNTGVQSAALGKDGIFGGSLGWLAFLSQSQTGTKQTNRLLTEIRDLMDGGLVLKEGTL
jgi:hypothetical protein